MTTRTMIPTCEIICGDALEKLKQLPEQSIQMCVTSPPYYGLRDYGHDGQLGNEDTPGQYIENIVRLGRRIRHTLRNDGTFWLNLGDSYYNYRPGCTSQVKQTLTRHSGAVVEKTSKRSSKLSGFKEKDRLMIPARCAIALQADGWYLRDEIVWFKPNPMVESVRDRTTKAHEFIYLLTKKQDYYYDADAIREKGVIPEGTLAAKGSADRFNMPGVNSRPPEYKLYDGMRNKRSVWNVATDNGSGEHFAVFPPDLIKPCILAGSRPGDTVLDPCGGRGTLGKVAMELGRNAILIEINPKYAALCAANIDDTTPGLPL